MTGIDPYRAQQVKLSLCAKAKLAMPTDLLPPVYKKLYRRLSGQVVLGDLPEESGNWKRTRATEDRSQSAVSAIFLKKLMQIFLMAKKWRKSA